MSYENTITASQCLAARAMLGWSRDVLAEKAKVGVVTLADFEAGKRSPYARTLADVQQALEAAGIIFIPAGSVSAEGGAGVRLRASEET